MNTVAVTVVVRERKAVEVQYLTPETVAKIDGWIGKVLQSGGYGSVELAIDNAGKRQILNVHLTEKVS